MYRLSPLAISVPLWKSTDVLTIAQGFFLVRNMAICLNLCLHLTHIYFPGLLNTYNSNHPDYQSTNMAMIKMQTIIRKMTSKLQESENGIKLAELQRDMGATFEGLRRADRDFIREGCLQKLSRKGYQQRMFFLVSLLRQLRRTKRVRARHDL